MDFGDFLWSLLVIYFIFFYFMILFRVIGDLFSDKEASGLEQDDVAALPALPAVPLAVHLPHHQRARHDERAMARAAEQNAAQQDYIRQVAGSVATTRLPRSPRRTSCSAPAPSPRRSSTR